MKLEQVENLRVAHLWIVLLIFKVPQLQYKITEIIRHSKTVRRILNNFQKIPKSKKQTSLLTNPIPIFNPYFPTPTPSSLTQQPSNLPKLRRAENYSSDSIETTKKTKEWMGAQTGQRYSRIITIILTEWRDCWPRWTKILMISKRSEDQLRAEIKPITPVNLRPPRCHNNSTRILSHAVWPLGAYHAGQTPLKYPCSAKGSSGSQGTDFHSNWSILTCTRINRSAR